MAYVIWRSSPRARKEHQCDMCSRVIRVGELYHRDRAVDDEAFTYKGCAHCETVWTQLDDLAEYLDGEGLHPDTLREWEPQGDAETRWLAQWRRKWTRRDGTLYPVPGERASEPIQDHDFRPVAGHPDDDECTHRTDGTDATYCGAPSAAHAESEA